MRGEREPIVALWRRPGGEGELFRLAGPLVVATMSWAIINACDRALLSQYSSEAMPAAFFASTIWFACVAFPLGICMYTSTLVAQYEGSSQPRRVSLAAWQGIWIALIATPVVMMGIPCAPALFSFAGHSDAVTVQEVQYFRILCIGVGPMLVGASLASYFIGRGKVGVVMLVDSTAAVVNLALDYCLIFGHMGFPPLGVSGTGWATVAAIMFKCAIYLALMLCRSGEHYGIRKEMRFNARMFGGLVLRGVPVGVQLLLEVVTTTIFIAAVSGLGEAELTANAAVFTIASLAALPALGLGQAATVLVGRFQGQGRSDLASRSAWSAIRVVAVFASLMSAVYAFKPDWLLASFFAGGEDLAGKLAAAQTMATKLLCYLAFQGLIDAVRLIVVGALKGAGDTWLIGVLSFLGVVVIPAALWVGIGSLGFGVFECWFTLAAWTGASTMIIGARFFLGKWKTIQVIEPSNAGSQFSA